MAKVCDIKKYVDFFFFLYIYVSQVMSCPVVFSFCLSVCIVLLCVFQCCDIMVRVGFPLRLQIVNRGMGGILSVQRNVINQIFV